MDRWSNPTISIALRLEKKNIKNGELCKVVAYKVRIQESFVFLYANNDLSKILRKILRK